ncbi:type II toxin-antitoxin system YafO family toxin [Shewanella sp. NKUCC05_KAH]|uniref:type II toxin-antitoxin system YafO family toxin n=1 Tax=Shewanella sp. NKUCC05_KAH TaxID=2842126 RepID=UPI001C5ADF23|nr:type II toxin-antitoxin system YafO family toxin [Gammaproteobacteria bacterium]MBW3529172.1 type II toxin-antitoxin system YafO family toxin [Shewanella sp. NKUCC05_KAH]MBU1476478.1 type II toxin-antitoxin system YafO family toxin [Gammaproteobacteria bacterium]MBU2003061.1 type II toxin-antitoxin system YafO family toxin [Gammaproteobacteria bacterium]MBU2130913.1 type II toxin-antitoxin system YafO family toxin [Gammaproteobacteria bacterium]
MAATVTFEQNLESQLAAKGFKLTQLKNDLELYFSSEKTKRAYYLGKDTPYRDPKHVKDSELHHIHIFVKGISCPQIWGAARTSNSYIVYTFGYFDEDAIHVIDFLSEQAHEKSRANNYSLIIQYKVVADNFRTKF